MLRYVPLFAAVELLVQIAHGHLADDVDREAYEKKADQQVDAPRAHMSPREARGMHAARAHAAVTRVRRVVVRLADLEVDGVSG